MASPVHIKQNDSTQTIRNSWKMAYLATFFGLNAALAFLICASRFNAADKNSRNFFQDWQTQDFGNDCPDATIGENVSMGSRVHIGCGAQIGSNVKIGNDVEIGRTVKIGDRSVILNGVKLWKSSLGPSALVACSLDGAPCNVTLKNCVVEREAVVLDMGVIENKRFRRQATYARERRAVDRSDCKAGVTDVSQCCRSTNGKVMTYQNCKDTAKNTYVPVLSKTSTCATGSCKGTNVNMARSSVGSCSSGLSEAGFSLGLQSSLAPSSNYQVTSHQCMANSASMQGRSRRALQGAALARQRRQAELSDDDGVVDVIEPVQELPMEVTPVEITPVEISPFGSSSVTSYYFNKAGLASLSSSLVDPSSETYRYLGSQSSYWTEVQDSVYPTIKGTVIVAVLLSADEALMFDFDLWSQNFMTANPGYRPVHFFNRTTCSKIITMKAPSTNKSPSSRVNVTFQGPGKVDTVVYHNFTQAVNGSQAFTGCVRADPQTLALPLTEDPMEFDCLNDGNNMLQDSCIEPAVEATPVMDHTLEELGMG